MFLVEKVKDMKLGQLHKFTFYFSGVLDHSLLKGHELRRLSCLRGMQVCNILQFNT